VSKARQTLPRNRKLYRVRWWYLTEGDEFKVTTSILLTEAEAEAHAIKLAACGNSDPHRRPQVCLDEKAAHDYITNNELKKVARHGR
jgi:hypothetical protein